jgi:shikimate kinase
MMLEIDLAQRVVAPGGSIVYHPDLMEFLKQHATIVYLDDSFENIKEHLEGTIASRGIVGLRGKPLIQLYHERKRLYSSYTDITVNCRGKPRQRLLREILGRFLEMRK